MRRRIIYWKNGTNNFSMNVMTHMDDMKRIFFTKRNYYFTRIEPYSLVIALQDNYGFYTLNYDISEEDFHPLNIFLARENQHWVIHPDWMYFEQIKNVSREFAELTPKEKLRIHLTSRCSVLHKCKKDKYFELLRLFLIDLESTDWFEEKITDKMKIRYLKNEYLYASVVVAFMSTHSGLTRWQYLYQEEIDEKNFGRVCNKSIDEVWYKRAVEENKDDYPDMYVLSVPLDIKEFDENEVMATVTHSIFRDEKSPIAVIGYQMRYSALKTLFESIDCENTILVYMQGHENVTCIIIDNHGYIFFSENMTDIGQLILDYNKNLTQHLEDDGIFNAFKVFDYQGICFPPAFTKSCPASGDETCRITTHNLTLEYQERAILKKTPTPCDKEMRMYRYTYKNYYKKNDPHCRYIVQHIESTNLALLIYASDCFVKNLREDINSTYPREKLYGNESLPLPCHIEMKNSYDKRPYIKCITADESEKTINKNVQYCGGNVEEKHIKDEL